MNSHKVKYNGTEICKENKENLFIYPFSNLFSNVFRDLTLFFKN